MANYTQDFGQTLLPLDNFRRFMSLDPYLFWQMEYTGHQEEGHLYRICHNRWQNDAQRGPGRYDIIDALIQAEEAISEFDEWFAWPAPKYIEEEESRLIKPNDFTYMGVPYTLMTNYWKIQSVGAQTWDLIEADVALAYDGDDVTCDVTIDAGTTEDEVVICYPDTTVPIRPISVSISGTTATITLKRWLCGDPDLWDVGDAIDATDVGNLLSEVDVYRVWIDPSDQITIIWEPTRADCNTTGICGGNAMAACASTKDKDIGVVGWQVGEYDDDTEKWAATDWPVSRFPDLAKTNYTAGMPTSGDRYMSRKMQAIVCKLAAGNLADYVYDAASRPEILYYWMEDFSEPISGELAQRRISPGHLDNPFGTKRGQVDAWKAMKSLVGM